MSRYDDEFGLRIARSIGVVPILGYMCPWIAGLMRDNALLIRTFAEIVSASLQHLYLCWNLTVPASEHFNEGTAENIIWPLDRAIHEYRKPRAHEFERKSCDGIGTGRAR